MYSLSMIFTIIAEPNPNISYLLVIRYLRFVGTPEPNLFISYVLLICYPRRCLRTYPSRIEGTYCIYIDTIFICDQLCDV